MLSAIETGRVRRVVHDCAPEYAFYEAITDHVRRAVGKVPYGNHGPRYVLDPDGTVRRDGNFEGLERTYSPAEADLRWQFGKSAIYRFLADRPPRPTEDDIRTTLAIVRRSRDLLVEQYPGLKFQVIFWPDWNTDGDLSRELQDGFRRMKIPSTGWKTLCRRLLRPHLNTRLVTIITTRMRSRTAFWQITC